MSHNPTEHAQESIHHHAGHGHGGGGGWITAAATTAAILAAFAAAAGALATNHLTQSMLIRIKWDPLESTCRHASLSIL